MTYEDNYLMHYGIKGQRWGIRRFQNDDGTLTTEGKEHYGVGSRIKKKIHDSIQSTVERHKSVSKMDDQELRDRVNRLQMEANYKRLVKELNEKPKKAKEPKRDGIFKKALVGAATVTLTSIMKEQMQIKSDDLLAKRRLERSLRKASKMDEALEPFRYFKPKNFKG